MGHPLNAQTLIKTEELKVSSKFAILCWAIFIAILGCMQSPGHELDSPDGEKEQMVKKNTIAF